MKTHLLNGGTMALMVAGLFATASLPAAAATHDSGTAMVKCVNSSSCKGQGACKQASNSCKGQNACKGQGFTMQPSQEACSAAQAAAKK